jgi:TolA-binding protein
MRGARTPEPGATKRDEQHVPAAQQPTQPPAAPQIEPRAPGATPDGERGRTAQQAAPSIAREIEQLDAARDHLSHGDALGALSELDAYAREHATGALRQEASVLRIEALVQSGNRDAARGIAVQFLRDHPQSPHAARVRALVTPSDER